MHITCSSNGSEAIMLYYLMRTIQMNKSPVCVYMPHFVNPACETRKYQCHRIFFWYSRYLLQYTSIVSCDYRKTGELSAN